MFLRVALTSAWSAFVVRRGTVCVTEPAVGPQGIINTASQGGAFAAGKAAVSQRRTDLDAVIRSQTPDGSQTEIRKHELRKQVLIIQSNEVSDLLCADA